MGYNYTLELGSLADNDTKGKAKPSQFYQILTQIFNILHFLELGFGTSQNSKRHFWGTIMHLNFNSKMYNFGR